MREPIYDYEPTEVECSPQEATAKFLQAMFLSKGKTNTREAANMAKRKNSTAEDIARIYTEPELPNWVYKVISKSHQQRLSKLERLDRQKKARQVYFKDAYWYKVCERKGVKTYHSGGCRFCNPNKTDNLDAIDVTPLFRWGSTDSRGYAENVNLPYDDVLLGQRYGKQYDGDILKQRNVAQFMTALAKALPEPELDEEGNPQYCAFVKDGRAMRVMADGYGGISPLYEERHSKEPINQTKVYRLYQTILTAEIKWWADMTEDEYNEMMSIGTNANCMISCLLTNSYSQLRYKLRSQERVFMALEALEYMGLGMYSNSASAWANITPMRKGFLELCDRIVSGRNKFISMVKRGYDVEMVRDEVSSVISNWAKSNCGQHWKFKPLNYLKNKSYDDLKPKAGSATKSKQKASGLTFKINGVEVTV